MLAAPGQLRSAGSFRADAVSGASKKWAEPDKAPTISTAYDAIDVRREVYDVLYPLVGGTRAVRRRSCYGCGAGKAWQALPQSLTSSNPAIAETDPPQKDKGALRLRIEGASTAGGQILSTYRLVTSKAA